MGDRSSNVDYEDCTQCAEHTGSGVCSNCENDGSACVECSNTGRCSYCDGTGRSPIEPDPELLREVEEAGPLIAPEEA